MGTDSAHDDDGANFAVSGGDRNANLGSNENCEGCPHLDTEPTENRMCVSSVAVVLPSSKPLPNPSSSWKLMKMKKE